MGGVRRMSASWTAAAWGVVSVVYSNMECLGLGHCSNLTIDYGILRGMRRLKGDGSAEGGVSPVSMLQDRRSSSEA